jgi:uncharacterized membrane protein YecN with MAPEG domain
VIPALERRARNVQVNVVEFFPIFVVMLAAAAMALVRLSV